MNKFYLKPIGIKQKSFYKKAVVEEYADDPRGLPTAILYSYKTPVFAVVNGVGYRLWDGESVTTLKHVNAFMNSYGFYSERYRGVEWWRSRPIHSVEWVKDMMETLGVIASEKEEKEGAETMSYHVSGKVMDHLVTEMVDVLKERNYPCDEENVQRIVEDSVNAKASLLDVLSKHSNWDENELRIHFNADFVRNGSVPTATTKLNAIHCALDNCYFDLKEKYKYIGAIQHFPEGAFTPEFKETVEKNKEEVDRAQRLARFTNASITWSEWAQNPTVTEAMAQYAMNGVVSGVNERIHVKAGAKSTKAYWKMLRELDVEKLPEDVLHEVRRLYAEYSDAMNPITIRRHTVLSVNPTDFLLMSNGNSWTSCHNINDGPEEAGCYSGGTLSYPMDEETMIFYTVEASVDEVNLTEAPKVTRQLYFWNGTILTGSRIYPQDTDGDSGAYSGQRAVVEQIMAECLEAPNLWKKLPFKASYNTHGLHYPDYSYHDYPSFHLSSAVVNNTTHEIGGYSICPKCGCDRDDDYSDNILCRRCERTGRGAYCADCGEWHELDDMYYDEDHDEYFCRDCVSYCDLCGCYEPTKYGESNQYGEWFCRDCVRDRIGDGLERCEECGEIFRGSDVSYYTGLNLYLCDECAKHVRQCEHCGDYMLADDCNEFVVPATGEILFFCNDDCCEAWEAEHPELLVDPDAEVHDPEEDVLTLLDDAA